jgi:hypothetical protein
MAMLPALLYLPFHKTPEAGDGIGDIDSITTPIIGGMDEVHENGW